MRQWKVLTDDCCLQQQLELLTGQLLGIPDLMAEIQRLRAENEQLRRYY